MDSKTHFKKILKGKGTGKTMSKHMGTEDIKFILTHLKSSDIPLDTKSTLLTAWLMLDNTKEELNALNEIKNNKDTVLPKELHFLFDTSSTDFIDLQIQTLLNHQNLNQEILTRCLTDITNHKIPTHKAAALLEGLRLKEETFEENTSVYDFFRKKATTMDLNIPLLIDIATPYDGFNRHYFLQPFLAALLASIGIPSILHGVKEVSPKNGMNTHKLFLMADKNPLKQMADVKQDILSRHIGWGYIDQATFCPELHALIPTRIDMVKRPVLATIEKWLQPFSAERTICLTGFTHPPYKQKTIDMIKYSDIYDDLILVRGIEGSTLLPYDRRAPFIVSQKHKEPVFDFISPSDVSHTAHELAEQDPKNSLINGVEALSGKNPSLSNYLCYQALVIGKAIGYDTIKMTSELENAITSGKALSHWDALI